LPGQPLGPSAQYKPGTGTHLPSPQSTVIHASILGPVSTTPAKKGLSTVTVTRQSQTAAQTSLLPKEGNLILGRVTRINIREARVQILVINDVPVMEEFAGVIRLFPTPLLKRRELD
jgi:exosome complex component CSL4